MSVTATAESVIPHDVEVAAPVTEPELMDHEYDGIQEYDNPLPGWWRMIFWLSIAFAAVYGFVYAMGWPKTTGQKYREEEVAYLATHEQQRASVTSTSEEALAGVVKDSAMLERGQATFVARCAMCHTADGHGLVGPNLTDLFQIHGTTRLDLFTTIRDGAPGTAMMPWGSQLSSVDIIAVAGFVSSLQGTNVANGKAPQGKPVARYRP